MKKNFEQPELMVVRMANNIIATSEKLFIGDDLTSGDGAIEASGAGRYREDWE